MVAENKLGTFVYNTLLDSHSLHSKRWSRGYWNALWNWSLNRYSGPVSTNVHGARVLVNFGNSYPLFARRFRHWNNPLLELVNQTYRALNRPITVIDIGAGIGDTALLIRSNCGAMVGDVLCVEGHAEFYSYLKHNLGSLPNHILRNVMLSDQIQDVASLVKHHPGTASAQGMERTSAITVDVLLQDAALASIDLLKIDVDGFDGRVMAGARRTLAAFRPSVIFEWHPILCRETGNEPVEHFRALTDAGYDRFVWFTKYGDFSHFMSGFDEVAVDHLTQVCLRGAHDTDWHYDVVALPPGSPISEAELAELQFAKRRRSWY
jgi:FkbM family methyltransferase